MGKNKTPAILPTSSSPNNGKTHLRKILCWSAGLISSVLFAILLALLILKPIKPEFSLHWGSIYTFNQSGSVAGDFLTATLQVTIFAKNPNTHAGILFEKLSASAYYRAEPVAGESGAAAVGPSYLGRGEEVIWSPFLSGREVPVSPGLWSALEQDKSAGVMLLQVKMERRARWRVGSWMSGGYGLFVSCPALFSFDGVGEDDGDGLSSSVLKFGQPSACVVHV